MRRQSFAVLSQLLAAACVAALPLLATAAPLETPRPAGKVAPKAKKAGPAKVVESFKARRLADGPNRQVAQADKTDSKPPVIRASSTAAVSLTPEDPLAVAAKVDALINAEIQKSSGTAAPRCTDEDFLRRVSFDIAGVSPTPQEVTLFGLDPDSNKRAKVIDRLLASSGYAENWSRYWRDVIFSRATQMRAGQARQPFETWMTEQLKNNVHWDQITSAMITALGPIEENGQTALIYAQQVEPDEVASEVSRIFLGIQIQCANCHDHPTDSWKRDQFHGLAAFFPRVRLDRGGNVQPPKFALASFSPPPAARGRDMDINPFQNPERLIAAADRDRDGKVSKEEAGRGQGGLLTRLFERGDTNNDGFLTVDEIKKLAPPMMGRRPTAEYYMPDLQNPQSRGTKFDPVFFLGDLKPGEGLSDLERRESLAKYITSPGNPWFAKAIINRLWAQMLGEGFYMPVDDIGPERTASHAAALDALAGGFTASGYDLQWLFRTIANTEAYQRQIRSRDPKNPGPAFASASLTRLRADQLYDALAQILGITDAQPRMRTGPGGFYRQNNTSLQGQLIQHFGFDPSTAPEEIVGTVPQALLMMNSPQLNGLIRAGGRTRLAQLLDKYKDDTDALKELYILVHAREPSDKELKICREYIKQVNNRSEAFEDLLWSLINSTEFQTKR